MVPSAYVPDRGGTMHAVLVAVGGITTTTDQMHFVVLYAAPLAAVDAAQDTVMFYLLFGVPILIVIAGAATYFFAGRALRPVEAIRARVASMSEKDLAERVPVPAARDEVGRLAETMNGMIARLEQAQKVQRRFVADASHELRSPLATIGAGLELLQDSEPAPCGRCAARPSGSDGWWTTSCSLPAPTSAACSPGATRWTSTRSSKRSAPGRTEDGVRTEVRTEHVRVVGDRGQLVRVLRNLVDNAHRHAGAQVVVTLGRDGDQAALDVADDGPGVPADDRSRIFERFVRLDDARARADGGSGLGLAIVAEVVAAHDGKVWVEENPGGGALFRVRLPAAELPAEDDAELPDPPAAATTTAVAAAAGATPQAAAPTAEAAAPVGAGANTARPANGAAPSQGSAAPAPAPNGAAPADRAHRDRQDGRHRQRRAPAAACQRATPMPAPNATAPTDRSWRRCADGTAHGPAERTAPNATRHGAAPRGGAQRGRDRRR